MHTSATPTGGQNAPSVDERTGIDDAFDAAPCGYLLLAADGRITNVNRTLCHWLRTEPSSLLGMPFEMFMTVDSGREYRRHLASTEIASGRPGALTVELRVGETGRLPVLLAANARLDADGEPVAYRVTAHDATPQRRFERSLVGARARADNARGHAEAAQHRAETTLDEAEAEHTRVRLLARTLQRTLLPPSLTAPEAMTVDALYHHASGDEVGGDFYDLFPVDEDRWAFFLGDVSGKGAGAAAVTSLTRYTLRAAAVFDDDPLAVLTNLNAVLHHEFQGSDPRFCTVVFGLICPRTEGGVDIRLASGGHPPALHLRSDGTAEYISTTGGQLVGALAQAHFVSAELALEPGEALVLYTDGLTEARTAIPGQRYDDEGALLEFANSIGSTAAPDVVAAIGTLLKGFGAGLQDDVAVMTLSADPASVGSAPDA